VQGHGTAAFSSSVTDFQLLKKADTNSFLTNGHATFG